MGSSFRKIQVVLLLILLFGVRVVSAQTANSEPRATTRYVSKAGTDSGNCTPSSSACATIAYAKSQSFAGDTILLGRSSFDLDGVFTQSATIDFPLTIEGRSITIFPTVAWVPCTGTACPTLTPPAGQNALFIGPDSAETVTINNLNFAGSNGASAVEVDNGKAVFNGCTFTNNKKPNGNGGAVRVSFRAEATIDVCDFTSNTGASGGAISASGKLTVEDATFRLNLATDGGAIDSSDIFNANDLTITDTSFEQNSSTNRGGAVYFQGNGYTISSSNFISNTSDSAGGAISAIVSQTATLSDGLFQGNRVESPQIPYGAAIDHRFGTATFTNLTIQDNYIERVADFGDREFDWGGAVAIRNGGLTLISNTISDNVVEGIGGVGAIVVRDGSLSVFDSTVSDHNSEAVRSVADGSTASSLLFRRSTLSNNQRSIVLARRTSLTFANSTIYAGGGLGIFALYDTNVELQYATIASETGFPLAIDAGTFAGSFEIENSIVSGRCSNGADLMDWDSRSIFDNSNCQGPNSNLVADVGLAPLANYGGPTETMYLLNDSPGIDAGLQSACFGLDVDRLDQRGIGRPIGVACDLGAVENNALPLAVGMSQVQAAANRPGLIGLIFVALLLGTGWLISAEKPRYFSTNN